MPQHSGWFRRCSLCCQTPSSMCSPAGMVPLFLFLPGSPPFSARLSDTRGPAALPSCRGLLLLPGSKDRGVKPKREKKKKPTLRDFLEIGLQWFGITLMTETPSLRCQEPLGPLEELCLLLRLTLDMGRHAWEPRGQDFLLFLPAQEHIFNSYWSFTQFVPSCEFTWNYLLAKTKACGR